MVRLPKFTDRPAVTFRLQHNIRIHLKVEKEVTKFYYRIGTSHGNGTGGAWVKFAVHHLRYCPACQERQPNQMAHMDPGYCLSEEWMTAPNSFFKFYDTVDHLLTLSGYRLSRLRRLLESTEHNFRRVF